MDFAFQKSNGAGGGDGGREAFEAAGCVPLAESRDAKGYLLPIILAPGCVICGGPAGRPRCV